MKKFLLLIGACVHLVACAGPETVVIPSVLGAAAAVTYEDCKKDGIDSFEDCASRTWREKKPVDPDKLND